MVPIANIGDYIWVLIPLAPFGIALIAILVGHQQKMAQILHGGQNAGAQQDVAALREEVETLRDKVNSQALEIDKLRAALPASTSSIAERTNVVN